MIVKIVSASPAQGEEVGVPAHSAHLSWLALARALSIHRRVGGQRGINIARQIFYVNVECCYAELPHFFLILNKDCSIIG